MCFGIRNKALRAGDIVQQYDLIMTYWFVNMNNLGKKSAKILLIYCFILCLLCDELQFKICTFREDKMSKNMSSVCVCFLGKEKEAKYTRETCQKN